MPVPRVVNTFQPPGAEMALERRGLADAGVAVELVSFGKMATPAQCVEAARDADVVLVGAEPFTADVLAALPRPRALVRYGIGVDTIDVDAATAHGILVVNVADYCIEEVSNQAMAMLLACNRRLLRVDRGVRAGRWAEARTSLAPMGRLAGQVLGLVGLGNIGRAVARKAQGFGLKVVAFDPFVRADAAPAGVALVGFDALLAEADYVSLHLPLTSTTRHLFDTAALARMKPQAYLINTSRGGLVDEAALATAIAAGRLGGAGLDVFEVEPPAADNPLLAFDSVIVAPHSGNFSDHAIPDLYYRVGQEAAKVLKGLRPSSVVNATVLNGPNRLNQAGAGG